MALNQERILAQLKLLAQEPDALKLVSKHAANVPGPWNSWTLERQMWYLRKRRHLTQADLARKSGITQARLSRIESGADFKWSTLAALFAALGCRPTVLPGPPGLSRKGRAK